MKWVRGKKGRREAISETTGARYVCSEGVLRVARSPGAWEHLGHYDSIEKADQAASDRDVLIAQKLETETRIRAEGLALAQQRAEVRKLFHDVFIQGPVGKAYREYCRCREGGISSEELIAQLVARMKSLSSEESRLLGRCFEDFFVAGMRLKPGGTTSHCNPG